MRLQNYAGSNIFYPVAQGDGLKATITYCANLVLRVNSRHISRYWIHLVSISICLLSGKL